MLELRNTDCIRNSVLRTYTKGPFAFEMVEKLNCEQVHICNHCLNHIRKRKFKNLKKKMLPMDHYLLSLLNMEMSNLMDLRSKKRMQLVLKERNNFYRYTSIIPLQTMIHKHKKIENWWLLNLRTFFFVGGRTSRSIRLHIN